MKIKRLRDLREDNDLTQQNIADLLKISQRTYSHYENGTRSIPLELLIQLSNYYKTSIDYIVGKSNKK